MHCAHKERDSLSQGFSSGRFLRSALAQAVCREQHSSTFTRENLRELTVHHREMPIAQRLASHEHLSGAEARCGRPSAVGSHTRRIDDALPVGARHRVNWRKQAFWGWWRARIPRTGAGARGRLPRRATGMCAGCWSSRRGAIGSLPARPGTCDTRRRRRRRPSRRWLGRHRSACVCGIGIRITPARRCVWSPPRWHASWWGSSGPSPAR